MPLKIDTEIEFDLEDLQYDFEDSMETVVTIYFGWISAFSSIARPAPNPPNTPIPLMEIFKLDNLVKSRYAPFYSAEEGYPSPAI